MTDDTLDAMVRATAARAPHRPALVHGGDGLTYAELVRRADHVAAELAERGLGPGDVVAVRLPNLPRWAEVALGALRAGVAVTGVSPAATDAELAWQVEDSGARLVVMETIEGRPGGRVAPETALLPYSSGTTGLPHAVAITHANLSAAVQQFQAGLRLTERDTLIAVAPFAHIMGFVPNLAVPLAAGATVVTMPRFEPAAYLELAARHRATVLIGAPPLMRLLAAGPELPDVELIVSGGAPLSAALQRAVAARHPRAAVGQGWGMTETTCGATMPDRATGTVPGSVGRAMPDTELRLVDGELWVRGPQVASGCAGPDGWLRTGDAGRIDEDGNVFIVDRLKELIKVSGYQVAPAELEAVLAEHPAVNDVAVVGRPDERRGEVPVAVVVGDVGEAELLAWAAERVAPYKRPRAVRHTDAIPRTASGKIVRRAMVG
jgi:acyl-CoA synthetase (AMP-forming)/AMP-acid ligase II